MDPGVHALQYLDVIQMKDSTHKSNFYHNLKGALSSIPKVNSTSHTVITILLIISFLIISFLIISSFHA